MEHLYKLVCEAPAERLAVVLCVFFIGLMAVAICQLWQRNRTLESELSSLHEMQRRLVGQVMDSVGGKER